MPPSTRADPQGRGASQGCYCQGEGHPCRSPCVPRWCETLLPVSTCCPCANNQAAALARYFNGAQHAYARYSVAVITNKTPTTFFTNVIRGCIWCMYNGYSENHESSVRIDFTPRRSLLGCEVRFLPGNLIDFTPRRSGSGRKVNFYPKNIHGKRNTFFIESCGI